jgi:hypothetical protein
MPVLCDTWTAHIDGVAISACITPIDSIGTQCKPVVP